MTSKPRTIDNLGIEASAQYARGQQNVNPSLAPDSQRISQQTATVVSHPYAPSSAFVKQFSIHCTGAWSIFAAPPAGIVDPSLFSYQTIPSLGDAAEETTNIAQTIDRAHEAYCAQDLSLQAKAAADQAHAKLSQLAKAIEDLDRNLELTNARRNQYQRG